ETERQLQEALHSFEDAATHYKQLATGAQASAVLANAYVGRVFTQLQEAEERRKKPKKKGRLNGDGMPKLLTGDDFFNKVLEHDAIQEAATKKKETRADVLKVYREQMEGYKKKVDVVKAANEKIKAAHAKALDKW
ncbi:hypothetical protein K435DRAFT_609342, partial [Dendrothele bispora CBS 962.96]